MNRSSFIPRTPPPAPADGSDRRPFARAGAAAAIRVMIVDDSLTVRKGEHWLTAMGEVPPATLREFAQSLERLR